MASMPLVQERTPRAQVQESGVAGYVDGVLVPSLPLALEHLDNLQRLTAPDNFERFKPWSLLKTFSDGGEAG